MSHTILLTFDIEDWFQVENFKQCIPSSSWPSCELRVEKNTHKILNLLDSVGPNSLKTLISPTNGQSSVLGFSNSPNTLRLTPNGSIKATFFILGWIAERLPHLVREIHARGHEVASHGYYHKLCKEQSAEDLEKDLVNSRKLLEDIAGTSIYGYRAPSFSINRDILKIIKDSGYFYDSSFNSFKLNRRYGQLEFHGNKSSKGIVVQMSDRLYELPISNLGIGKQIIPWGGGGYFRLIPLELFKRGVQSILKKHEAYLFYLHPWEIDPDQPKMMEVHFSLKLRHYINLGRTLDKLRYFVENFKECYFQTCHQYLISHAISIPKRTI